MQQHLRTVGAQHNSVQARSLQSELAGEHSRVVEEPLGGVLPHELEVIGSSEVVELVLQAHTCLDAHQQQHQQSQQRPQYVRSCKRHLVIGYFLARGQSHVSAIQCCVLCNKQCLENKVMCV